MQDVAGGARLLGYDGDLFIGEGVHQGRLAYVGLPGDGDGDALAESLQGLVVLQDFVELLEDLG